MTENKQQKEIFNSEDLLSSEFMRSKISDAEIKMVKELFDATDWRVVFLDGLIDRQYGKWETVSIFKALSLPYLLNIDTSERGLVRFINKMSRLKEICGFRPKDVPVERFLYDFRRKYGDQYPGIFLNILIGFVLSGRKPNLDLPFVEIIDPQSILDGFSFSLSWDEYRPDIEIFTSVDPSEIPSQSESEWKKRLSEAGNLLEYKQLAIEYEEIKRENRLLRRMTNFPRIFKALEPAKKPEGHFPHLRFPIDIKTTLKSGDKILFRLTEPVRHWRHKAAFSFPKKYWAACSIIVMRERNGRTEILLSKRLHEGWGMKQYALPGGKQRKNELMEMCAERELKEETGLKLIKRSRPISKYHRQRIEKPDVLTVGALVMEGDYIGEPEKLESHKHEDWKWESLDELPEPLFDPTRTIIDHYKSNTYPNLTWEKIDKFDQLQLFKTRT